MKIFIYPTFNPNVDINAYSRLFHEAFRNSPNWIYVNRLCRLSVIGIWANMDADVMVLNWPENVVRRKFSNIQMCLLVLGINVARLLNKQIIWVMHNKHQHGGVSIRGQWLMKFMSEKATLVLTHSQEGVRHFNDAYLPERGKCRYIPHPVYTTKIFPTSSIEWDYIIWGSIEPRKNILEFVEYTGKSLFFKDKRILICGRCKDEGYFSRIESICSNNITLVNKRVDDGELEEYIRKSKIVLFTYSVGSLLSSGALIYSINFLKPIVGPNVGSFVDLKGITATYESFTDIEHVAPWDNSTECKKYIEENTWTKLPYKLLEMLKQA